MVRKKASNGSGTIKKRSDGRWEGVYTVGRDFGTGNLVRKSVYGKTRDECAKKLRAATAAVDNGSYKEPSKLTVGQWLDIWQKEYLGNAKPATVARYGSHIEKNLKPYIGAIKLAALKPHQVQELYNKLHKSPGNPNGKLSAKTIKNLHGVLHKAMKQAVTLGYISKNPTEACILPRIEKKEVAFIEGEDIKTLLEAIDGHKFENLYKVDLFTGLRQGEILGLTWENVDFKNGIITVSQQLQKEPIKGGQYRLVSNKNDRIRRIKPADFVMDILKKQKVKQCENQLKAGQFWNNEWNLVFTNEIGKHLCISTVYKNFKKIMTEIGLPETRFHDMRHTYAMLSLQNGDDIKTVQYNVGHATAAFTLDVYGHVSQRMQQESADRMQDYFDGLKAE